MSNNPLASKVCVVCLRPFNWRKKWRKDWEQVKYCSKRCAGQRLRAHNTELESDKEQA
ncbi:MULTISPECIES: DUF2256 domain-containing protein [unclassified Shewanella]|uniref:DUF2256 domain-containing protein n=1 Tax=unclassified Shewanella TaxID=196818 RepID=UPI001BB9BF84|nr:MULTISPECIES: DUF2256 domain-containing protein [unclassified Shewanella]GIU05089.1 hypothetical protein TUM4444_00880 [Shewanella sp. MBTL60-112-B1]GIU24408.1 hypothetical protein TUM4445_01490 [Shewanella sp. MBTL60-112-B2]